MPRKLTPGETGLCRHVFRHALDPDRITLVGRPGYTLTSFVIGQCIHIGGGLKDDYIGADLSSPLGNPTEIMELLHEMAHCWQSAVGISLALGRIKATREGRRNRRAAGIRRRDFFDNPAQSRDSNRIDWEAARHASIYGYDAGDGADLLDFNIEQQADILADYFGTRLWRAKLGASDALSPAELAALEPVMARFNANPAYPRG